MKHQAFVFKDNACIRELAEILKNAFIFHQQADLIGFIDNNF
ncbi:hypothetical protein [Nostoc punctiforme]|nr:hypothetical protein [Nostoc punctiforme]